MKFTNLFSQWVDILFTFGLASACYFAAGMSAEAFNSGGKQNREQRL